MKSVGWGRIEKITIPGYYIWLEIVVITGKKINIDLLTQVKEARNVANCRTNSHPLCTCVKAKNYNLPLRGNRNRQDVHFKGSLASYL